MRNNKKKNLKSGSLKQKYLFPIYQVYDKKYIYYFDCEHQATYTQHLKENLCFTQIWMEARGMWNRIKLFSYFY